MDDSRSDLIFIYYIHESNYLRMFLKHVQLLVSIKNEKEKKLATSIRPVFKADRFDK